MVSRLYLIYIKGDESVIKLATENYKEVQTILRLSLLEGYTVSISTIVSR